MTEPTNPQRETGGRGHEEDETIAGLLRLAGPRPDASTEVKERVREIVHARWRQGVVARRRRGPLAWLAGTLAVAAVLVLAVMLETRRGGLEIPARGEPAGILILNAGVVRGPGGEVLAPGSEIPAGATLETAGNARAAFHLLDGATVRLDERTRLTLTGRSELKLERGTIYVESGLSKLKTGAIRIDTGTGIVRDLGTRFEVRVQDGELRVRVRQGIVSLDREGGSREIPSGTELILDQAGGSRTAIVPPRDPGWNWILAVAPEFEMEGRTLGEFLDWVSTETGMSVRFADASIERGARAIVLHGSVAGLRPDQTPGVVLPACGLSHGVIGDTLIVGRGPVTGGGK